jgi:hypothetical protein
MEVLDTRIEEAGPGMIRIITLVDTTTRPTDESVAMDDGLGEGPTHDAVTDHIVKALIEALPKSLSGAEVIRRTGDHPGTTYRQLRVLGTNSPECPHRLRGWVQIVGHGRYGLTPVARRRVESAA